jgi:Holliday junction resolvase RusA-like endonuclease
LMEAAQRLHFIVPGPVTPYQRVARSKSGHSYVPTESRQYRQKVKRVAESTLSHHPEWPRDKRYRVLLIGTFPDYRGRDLDNVAKQVNDALNKVVWNDDMQIDDIRVLRKINKDRLGLEVVVEAIEKGSVENE